MKEKYLSSGNSNSNSKTMTTVSSSSSFHDDNENSIESNDNNDEIYDTILEDLKNKINVSSSRSSDNQIHPISQPYESNNENSVTTETLKSSIENVFGVKLKPVDRERK